MSLMKLAARTALWPWPVAALVFGLAVALAAPLLMLEYIVRGVASAAVDVVSAVRSFGTWRENELHERGIGRGRLSALRVAVARRLVRRELLIEAGNARRGFRRADIEKQPFWMGRIAGADRLRGSDFGELQHFTDLPASRAEEADRG